MAILICLDELLKKSSMSVSELAALVGITRANVSNIKMGHIKAIRFSTLDRLCEVFGCQPGDLLKYEPNFISEPPQIDQGDDEGCLVGELANGEGPLLPPATMRDEMDSVEFMLHSKADKPISVSLSG
ncbi:helix-turn-helix domain-containing protein [Adlercreutzia caecimuris]|jgi:putative transcriptional regulator|uniref:helix-turn-helix domain-containing protein n=1 Tax=Adlercreutzia caecimuris TaxID=671266 RepID=UPI003D9BFF32